jgi:small subunit ribosomal protein S11
MGKKRIVTTKDKVDSKGTTAPKTSSKKKVESGILCVQSTYNNTLVLLTDKSGNALMASSAGALGFKGAKKGTPFAAAKVGEVLAEKAVLLGLKEISVVVKGVGSGRESAIRGFISTYTSDLIAYGKIELQKIRELEKREMQKESKIPSFSYDGADKAVNDAMGELVGDIDSGTIGRPGKYLESAKK